MVIVIVKVILILLMEATTPAVLIPFRLLIIPVQITWELTTQIILVITTIIIALIVITVVAVVLIATIPVVIAMVNYQKKIRLLLQVVLIQIRLEGRVLTVRLAKIIKQSIPVVKRKEELLMGILIYKLPWKNPFRLGKQFIN